MTARERERAARRRYQSAMDAAMESLRHAERRFGESAAAIDAHLQRALAAADSVTASVVAVFGLGRGKADAVPVTSARAGEMPA